MGKNFTGRPSFPASTPHASFGRFDSPCATISSKSPLSIRIIAGATTVAAESYSPGCSGRAREPALHLDPAGGSPHHDADVRPWQAPAGELVAEPLVVRGGDQQTS